jgi:hypothetical protein
VQAVICVINMAEGGGMAAKANDILVDNNAVNVIK